MVKFEHSEKKNPRYEFTHSSMNDALIFCFSWDEGDCEDKMGERCKEFDQYYCNSYPEANKYWCAKSCFNCEYYNPRLYYFFLSSV